MNYIKFSLITFFTIGLCHSAQARPQGPLVCKGEQELTLRGIEIHTDGVAVRARDDCTLRIEDCTLVGGEFGLKLSENATVSLKNCVVSGGKRGVAASENTDLKMKGGALHNGVRKQHNADVHLRGTQRHRRPLRDPQTGGDATGSVQPTPGAGQPRGGVRSKATGAPDLPSDLRRHRPIQCRGTKNLVVKDRYIEAKGPAVTGTGVCNITLIGCRIRSTAGIAIRMTGSGDLTLKDTIVEAPEVAIRAHGSGDTKLVNSTIIGRIRNLGSGRVSKDNVRVKRP